MRTMISLVLLGLSTLGIAAQPTAVAGDQSKDDWKTLRSLMDKDNNDKISKEEVNKFNLMPLHMLERNFSQIDSNKDGVVTLQEYTAYVQKLRSEWESEFQKADANKDGGLSKTELADTKPGQLARIKRQFEAMDTNKDGKVTMEERDRFTPDKTKANKARQERSKGKPRADKGAEQRDK